MATHRMRERGGRFKKMSSRLIVVLEKQWDTALQQEGSVLGKLDVFLFSPPSCLVLVAQLTHICWCLFI